MLFHIILFFIVRYTCPARHLCRWVPVGVPGKQAGSSPFVSQSPTGPGGRKLPRGTRQPREVRASRTYPNGPMWVTGGGALTRVLELKSPGPLRPGAGGQSVGWVFHTHYARPSPCG